jgi:hypothetical protein
MIEEFGALIFALFCLGLCIIIWYRVCFMPGKVEEWREQIIEAHRKSNSISKEGNFLFKPIVLKTVVTLGLLGGLLAVFCAIAEILQIW